MVGTPRAAGCVTCLKRKRKCGEERPACLACIAAGWKCPGYVRRWKFVDENKSLQTLYRRKKFGFEIVDPEDSSHEDKLQFRLSTPTGFDAVEVLHSGGSAVEVGVFWPLTSSSDRVGSMLCHILTDDRSQVFFSLQALGDFFPFIPSRLGINIALDSAVSCLCQIYRDVLNGRPTSHHTIKQYANSLNALQRCIKEPQLRLEPETICATILLQLCELMLSPDNGRWNNLSQGSQLLIMDRGPAGFTKPFERSILESQRAFFIVQARNARRPCFLAEPEWRNLLKTRGFSTVSGSRADAVVLRSQLCDFLVDLPQIIDDVSTFAAQSETQRMTQKCQVTSLIGQVSQLRLSMENWYEHEVRPRLKCDPRESSEETLSAGGSRLPDIETGSPTLEYRGLLFAVLDCVINLVLAQLLKILSTLFYLVDGDGGGAYLIGASNPDEYRRRHANALSAFAYVKNTSKVGAKPLGFGLQQLWMGDGILHSALGSHSPLSNFGQGVNPGYPGRDE